MTLPTYFFFEFKHYNLGGQYSQHSNGRVDVTLSLYIPFSPRSLASRSAVEWQCSVEKSGT